MRKCVAEPDRMSPFRMRIQMLAEPYILIVSLVRRPSVDFFCGVSVPPLLWPRCECGCGCIFNGGIFGCSIRVGVETTGLGELRFNVLITSCGS